MVEKALLEGHRSPSGMGMHLSCLCEQTQNFFADENAQKKKKFPTNTCNKVAVKKFFSPERRVD